LAIQLAARFPSPKLKNDVRWLLLNFPEKVIEEASSLEIMFGTSLPSDVSFQLKVRFARLRRWPGLII
jgi:phosphatidylinositol 4-kinase